MTGTKLRIDRIQAYIDSGKLDAKGVIDADALIAARVIRRAKDGVRLIGLVGLLGAKKSPSRSNHATAGATAASELARWQDRYHPGQGAVEEELRNPPVDYRPGRTRPRRSSGAFLAQRRDADFCCLSVSSAPGLEALGSGVWRPQPNSWPEI